MICACWGFVINGTGGLRKVHFGFVLLLYIRFVIFFSNVNFITIVISIMVFIEAACRL